MQHGGINKWKKACSPWSWLLTLEDFILIRVSSSQKQKREECCGEGKSLSRLVGKRRRFLPDRHSPFQFHFHPYQYHPRLSFSLRYWLYAPHRTAPPFISLNFFSGCLIILSFWISDLVENENGRMMSPMETERNPNYTAVFWLGIWSCLFLWTFCSTLHHQLSFRYKYFFFKLRSFITRFNQLNEIRVLFTRYCHCFKWLRIFYYLLVFLDACLSIEWCKRVGNRNCTGGCGIWFWAFRAKLHEWWWLENFH